MAARIEIVSRFSDPRVFLRRKKMSEFPFAPKIEKIQLGDVYTLDKDFTFEELSKISWALCNPLTQRAFFRKEKEKTGSYFPRKPFSWVFEIGFRPGVTDNVAHTASEIIEDLLGKKFQEGEGIYTSQMTFVWGDLSRKEIQALANFFFNPLIQRFHLKSFAEYQKEKGMDFVIPKVCLRGKNEVLTVNLAVSEKELVKIGQLGILDPQGFRRGPLALSLEELKAIQRYFSRLGRSPTDIELEALAQTWSEHCKHKIFASPLDELSEGLFKTYIFGATNKIRQKKGKKDGCVSVFSDNSGAVVFDQKHLLTFKVETHNTPSALDPFGGALTGIVGVNRDTIGFGLGAKPVANFYGFCLADPRKDIPLYKGENFTQKMLSSRKILEGVVEGVNSGGNQSGIPTPLGFLYFDERFRGKPLVFVGTLGLIPRKIKGRPSYLKKARSGDYIVMIGGRVGKDGIHGATFSSEALREESPVSAVQIGDPITQKKFSDALVKEARDLLLYESITDNGAGGLSSSVGEMAREAGGCLVELEKVPLKYPGLSPWEIWVSESQERMTLAVSPKKFPKFFQLLKRRGVEATVIGKFTRSGKCVVRFRGKKIMEIDLDFLHQGWPKKKRRTSPLIFSFPRFNFSSPQNFNLVFLKMLARLNLASFEFVSQQYDHLVQANSALSPLQGKGRVNSEVVAVKPVFDSSSGVVLSFGLYPRYSDLDCYGMALAALDTAVRNVVSVGASLGKTYLLDNFCWCSSNDPGRLWQLKQAVKACFVGATFYQTPFISGKDSLFNDFLGFDSQGKKIKISIPPTLLITALGLVEKTENLVSLEAKFPGDYLYILGETFEEMGGTEYLAFCGEEKRENWVGGEVPKVNLKKNRKIYQVLEKLIEKRLIASSCSLTKGGLGIALAKKVMGGGWGAEIDLRNLPGQVSRDDFALFSESQGRVLVSVAPEKRGNFEKVVKGVKLGLLGKVTKKKKLSILGLKGEKIVDISVKSLLEAYRKTFAHY